MFFILDPCEYHDLSGKYPAVVKRLKNKLDKHRKTMKPVWFPNMNINRANPKAHGGFWDIWRAKNDPDKWLIREKYRRLRKATRDEPILSDFRADFLPPVVQRAMMGVHNKTLGHMFHYHYHKNFPVHIPNVGELRTMKYRLAHHNLQQHTTFFHDKIQQKASRLRSEKYRPLKVHEVPFHVPGLVSGTKARKVPKKLLLKKANNHKAPHKKRTQAIIAKMRPMKRPQKGTNPESLSIYKVHAKTQPIDHEKVVSEETEQEDFDNVEDTVDSDDSADSHQQQAIFVPPYQAPQFQNQPTTNPWVYNASNGWPSHNTSYVNYG